MALRRRRLFRRVLATARWARRSALAACPVHRGAGPVSPVDSATRLELRDTDQGRVLVIRRGDAVLAQVPAPEPDDHIDDDDEMNDFFVWLVRRFSKAEARAAYTV